MLRQQYAHHRDLLARATTKESTHVGAAKDQDRHIMTATPLLDKCRNDCRLCWFSADSLNARVDALNFVVVKTKTLKISAHKTPAARSRPNSKFANGAKLDAPTTLVDQRAPARAPPPGIPEKDAAHGGRPPSYRVKPATTRPRPNGRRPPA